MQFGAAQRRGVCHSGALDRNQKLNSKKSRMAKCSNASALVRTVASGHFVTT